MKRIDTRIASSTARPPAESSVPKPRYTPRPGITTFDTMADSFSQSILSNDGSAQDAADLPPSPALTPTSTVPDDEEETFVPYFERMSRANNAMDWTPTRRRFGPSVETVAPAFSQPPAEALPAQRNSHSLLGQKDPNPFRQPIPAAPVRKGKSNPWRQPTFQPAPDYLKKPFLDEIMAKGHSSPEERARHEQRIRQGPSGRYEDRPAFQNPKLKREWFGFTNDKGTGLEDKLSNMFSGSD
jgi:hypothetical protein